MRSEEGIKGGRNPDLNVLISFGCISFETTVQKEYAFLSVRIVYYKILSI